MEKALAGRAWEYTPPMRVLLLLLVVGSAWGADRSAAERLGFKRENPCPSTGQRSGGCPGHVIDHIYPLCAGGPDHRVNMQWQTVEDAKRKDIDERRLCRALRRP
jgi:hypothetical protein